MPSCLRGGQAAWLPRVQQALLHAQQMRELAHVRFDTAIDDRCELPVSKVGGLSPLVLGEEGG